MNCALVEIQKYLVVDWESLSVRMVEYDRTKPFGYFLDHIRGSFDIDGPLKLYKLSMGAMQDEREPITNKVELEKVFQEIDEAQEVGGYTQLLYVFRYEKYVNREVIKQN